MNRRKYTILLIILILSIPHTYGGCVFVFSTGDIDKKNDPKDDDSSTVFVGSTSQAVIDSTNAKDLSAGGVAGSLSPSEAPRAGNSQDLRADQLGAFWPLKLPMTLKEALQKDETIPPAVAIFRPAVETRSGTLKGDCDGSLSYSIDFINESSLFDGSFSFENYCDYGITISGKTDFDGTYANASGEIITAYFSFANLTDGETTWDGEISMDFLHQPIKAEFSAYSKDSGSGQVYWLKDYAMNINEFAGYIELEISGTFYHPDHGYVTLTTTEPFIVHHEDDWPTSGLLGIEGQKRTQAELTAQNQLIYTVAADTDGDGVLDWDSGMFNWMDR